MNVETNLPKTHDELTDDQLDKVAGGTPTGGTTKSTTGTTKTDQGTFLQIALTDVIVSSY
jgi:hypothetical protein